MKDDKTTSINSFSASRGVLGFSVLGLIAGFSSIAQSDEPVDLDEVTLEGSESVFTAESDATLVRGGVDLEEVPRTIEVYDSSFFYEQLRVQNLSQAVSFAPNVIESDPGDGRGYTFLVRGFAAPVIRDGFRLEDFGTDPAAEMFAFESVEILKGGDSVQYGQSEPGGLINMVVKRPEGVSGTKVGFEYGDYGTVKPTLDHQGVFGSDGAHAYRLVAAYTYGDDWRDFDTKHEKLYVAPSFRTELTDRIDLTVLAESNIASGPADFGTALSTEGELIAPVDTPNNHPSDSFDIDFFSVGYDLDLKVSDEWTFQNRARWTSSEYDYSLLWLPFQLVDEESASVGRVPADQDNLNEELSVQLNTTLIHSVNGMENRLFAGVDLRWTDNSFGGAFEPSNFGIISLLNPDFGDSATFGGAEFAFPGSSETDRLGIFVQDYLTVSDQLTLSAGLRYDEVDLTSLNADFSGGDPTLSTQKDDDVTMQLGGVFRASDSVRFYANYAETFVPVSDTDINGDPLDPETGWGFDVGSEWTVNEGRLTISSSLFYIVKDNIVAPDLDDPAYPFGSSLNIGERTSQGIEIEVRGSLTENINLIAGIGYVDAEISDDDTLEDSGLPNGPTIEGNAMRGVPEITTDVWATYDFREGSLNGFGCGLGLSYIGERWAEDPNATELDSVTLLNAGVWYEVEDWRVAANVSNLSDKEYVDTAFGPGARGIHPGNPRQVVLSLNKKF
ncbi:MAG: TonB-dependent siderophore receptor [Verrucomicrobiota bacterium]